MNMFKIFFGIMLMGCALFGGEMKTVVLKGGDVPGKNCEENVQLAPGERVQLMLKSNPTTGYDWEFLLSLSGSVKVENNEFRPDNSLLCGAGGLRVLTLRGVKKGSGRILGIYRRSWEKFDPAKDQLYLLNFSVKEKK